MGHGTGRRTTTALLIVGLTLVLAATAFAALPKPGGRYAGTETNVNKIVGFSAPVRFGVAPGGRRLLAFTYGTLGCSGGAGGFKPGVNPYTRSDLIDAGQISVASSGTFAVTNAPSSYHSAQYGFTYTTRTTVHGKFTSRRVATGTITFSQTYTPKTGKASTCTLAVPRQFRATLVP